jgi:hypothetical protein
MSPQALLLAERIVCNKTKAIGARRCNTILINAGADPSQNSQRAERTLSTKRTIVICLFLFSVGEALSCQRHTGMKAGG